MKDNKDNYDFSLVSKSGKPGFELIQSPKDKKYYFLLNDEQGKALFFSQPYNTELGRDKGLASVRTNGQLKNRFQIVKSPEGYSISLKAGNHLEIAASRLFKDKKSADHEISFVTNFLKKPIEKTAGAIQKPAQAAINKTTPKVPQSTLEQNPEKSINKEKEPLTVSIESPKYSFRIDFYQPSADAEMVGRIEFLVGEEKMNFSGFDQNAIFSFIKKHLPQKIEANDIALAAAAESDLQQVQKIDIQPAFALASEELEHSVKPNFEKTHPNTPDLDKGKFSFSITPEGLEFLAGFTNNTDTRQQGNIGKTGQKSSGKSSSPKLVSVLNMPKIARNHPNALGTGRNKRDLQVLLTEEGVQFIENLQRRQLGE